MYSSLCATCFGFCYVIIREINIKEYIYIYIYEYKLHWIYIYEYKLHWIYIYIYIYMYTHLCI